LLKLNVAYRINDRNKIIGICPSLFYGVIDMPLEAQRIYALKRVLLTVFETLAAISFSQFIVD